jgi:hypothetical protein
MLSYCPSYSDLAAVKAKRRIAGGIYGHTGIIVDGIVDGRTADGIGDVAIAVHRLHLHALLHHPAIVSMSITAQAAVAAIVVGIIRNLLYIAQ